MRYITGTSGDDYLESPPNAPPDESGPFPVIPDNSDTIEGLGGNDTLIGRGGDVLRGGAGDDHLWGGRDYNIYYSSPKNDRLEGGTGNDTYHVLLLDDYSRTSIVVEDIDAGIDTVVAQGSYALAVNVEIFRLERASYVTGRVDLGGNDSNNKIYGTAGVEHIRAGGGDDLLYGFAGDDSLFGDAGDDRLYGGSGQDWLTGGTGNDVYYVEETGPNRDTIIEFAGGGDDTVITSVSYSLAISDEYIETLRTADPRSTVALNLSGNSHGQSIYGNAGNNIIFGGGGRDYLIGLAGNDTLDGGLGNDVLQGGVGDDFYIVDEAGADAIIESMGEGDDAAIVQASYTLGAGVELETLRFGQPTASFAHNLTGNEFGQSLYGNDGNNVLNGGGGIDYMIGRKGNDTYVIDHRHDVLSELANEGDDVLLTSVGYSLGAGQSIETIVVAHAAGAISLTGNEHGQSLYGNNGWNELNGLGGNDYLVGGAGADLFLFTTAPGAGNIDGIGDFQSGLDRIGIDNEVFTGLDGGALPAGAFASGSAARDADDRIIYDPTTGALWFDANGSGSGAAVQFAQLQPNLTLVSTDFVVI